MLADLIAFVISSGVIVWSWSQRSSLSGGRFTDFGLAGGIEKHIERSRSYLFCMVLYPLSMGTARMSAGRLLAIPFQIVV